MGYIASLLLVGFGLGIELLETRYLMAFTFPSLLFLFAVVSIALLWGKGPALLTIFLSVLVLDYFYVPPIGTFLNYNWGGLLQLLTFAVSGIIVALLINQREIARRQALEARHEAILRTRELEALSDALRATTHQMEDFLSMVCHELKTPLTVVQVNLQLTERKLKRLIESQNQEAVAETEYCLLSVHHLLMQAESQVVLQTRLINDLLNAARMQTQTLHICMQPCDLIHVVQEAVVQQRQIAKEHAIRLELPAIQALPVYADPDRITQIMANFLSNALKYSLVEAPIDVRLDVQQEYARVSVHNKGPAISAEEQQHIWERFYRSTKAHNAAKTGLGIGLYLCRTIVEQHGGEIGVQSSPEQGTTFWFSLPRMDGSTP